jgi:PAS domain S-box-containing protein
MPDQPSDFSAHRLAAIVESSEDAIISKDLDGVIASWNKAAERLFGYSAEEAIGQRMTLLIPADRTAEEAAVLARIRRNEVVDHFETIRQRKDGSLLDVSVTISPIRDSTGRIIGVSNITRDITDRRRAEAELEELRRRLMALLSASSDILQSPTMDDVQAATIATAQHLLHADAYALWRMDPVSGTWAIRCSDHLSDTFAARLLEADGSHPGLAPLPFSEPLPVPDVTAEPMLKPQNEAYAAEGIRSMLVVPLSVEGLRSGTIVFYWRTAHTFSSVEIETGRALASLASAAVSAAHLYEASEYAKQQATFLAKTGEIFSSSLEYEKTLAAVANLAVPYIADWCTVDLIGEGSKLQRVAMAHVDPSKVDFAKRLQERYPEDPNAPGGVHQVIRTGQPVMMSTIPRELLVAAARDTEHLRLLDELVLTSYICVPMTARRRTLGALTFVSAESGRHYTASDLQFAQDLASRAALAIDNAHAYRQATEANRLKDDFLATLSHELRTPLNAVLGYAKMLDMHMLEPSRQAHAISVIERNANSLKQIIEDVLDISRIVSGKLRLNVQAVQVSEIVKTAVATLVPAADAKNIRLQSVLDPQTPPISGDPDRLQQIVWNLLSNAVKFTPKGGRVQIMLQRVNSHVEIVVSDTGRGISPEFAPHLFERFRQADSAFSREHGGLGLGLAIVRELVELHGGTVRASSDGAGRGATFTVELPAMIVHQTGSTGPRRVHPRTDEGPGAAISNRLEGIRVMAVDDEDDALALLTEILEAAGAQVLTASSGPRALTMLGALVPDVLIADVGMPDMDGLQLIQRVRQHPNPAARSIPAVALTAYARAQDRIAALGNGFQMHIAKPVDPAELIVAISSLAQRTASR